MKHSRRVFVLAFIAAVMIGMPCLAQDVQPPFTWQGKGSATFISQDGTEDIEFQFEMSVDEQGMVEGKTVNEQGTSKVKHIFYTETKEYDFPGFFSRNIVIVILVNEYGHTPMLAVLNARVLMDKFMYGEVLMTRYEAGSDVAKALGVGDPEATLMYGDELPTELKAATKKCMPYGTAKIVGGYKNE